MEKSKRRRGDLLVAARVVAELAEDAIDSVLVGEEDEAAEFDLAHKEGIDRPHKEGGNVGVEERGLRLGDLGGRGGEKGGRGGRRGEKEERKEKRMKRRKVRRERKGEEGDGEWGRMRRGDEEREGEGGGALPRG